MKLKKTVNIDELGKNTWRRRWILQELFGLKAQKRGQFNEIDNMYIDAEVGVLHMSIMLFNVISYEADVEENKVGK